MAPFPLPSRQRKKSAVVSVCLESEANPAERDRRAANNQSQSSLVLNIGNWDFEFVSGFVLRILSSIFSFELSASLPSLKTP